jgi:hypothetical protein
MDISKNPDYAIWGVRGEREGSDELPEGARSPCPIVEGAQMIADPMMLPVP